MWILKDEKGMLCLRAQKVGFNLILLERIVCSDSEDLISSSMTLANFNFSEIQIFLPLVEWEK